MIAGVIIVKLSQQYPDKTFYQYNQDIIGKWLGWFISACVIAYFLPFLPLKFASWLK